MISRFALCIGLGLIGASVAQAEWTPQQRTEFMSECLDACRKNPKVGPAHRPQCQSYCDCSLSETRKISSYYAALTREVMSKAKTENVRRFNAIGPICNKRAFGT
jgi:hypothetical protein